MKLSKELQDTVSGSPRIKNVYFNSKGQHFFHTVEIDARKIIDERTCSKESQKLTVLPGVVHEPREFANLKPIVVRRIPIKWEEPAEAYSREDILSSVVGEEIGMAEIKVSKKKSKKEESTDEGNN